MLGGSLVGAPGTWTGSPDFAAMDFYSCTRADCADGVLRESLGVGYPSSYAYSKPLELGRWYRLVVSVHDPGVNMSAPAASAIVGPVLPHPPTPTTAPTVTSTPQDGADAVATPGGWHNGGAPGEPEVALRWQRCDAAGAACADLPGATAATYRAVAADVGHRLRVVATGTNDGGSATSASAPSAPVAPRNTVPPALQGTAADGEALSADAGAWNGVAGLALAYRWERCAPGGTGCAAIPGATTPAYTAGPLDVGSSLRAVVSASAAGSPATDAATTASAPVAPRATVLPAVDGAARDGATLTATSGGWNGAAGLAFSYRWLRCDAAGAGCVDLAGTSASYTATAADVGATLRVRVTADANGGRASSVSVATAVVAPRAPVAVDPPVVSGTPVDGGVLASTPGGWAGTGPLDVVRQWLRCDADGGACAAIPGADGPTLTLGGEDVGHTFRVRVTVTNSAGSASGTSAPSGIVDGVAPRLLTLPAVGGEPVVGTTLTATPGAWTGGALTLAYQWQRCDGSVDACSDIAGATAAVRSIAVDDVGQRLRVRVTAVGAGGTTTAASAATAVVRSADPAPRDGVDGRDGRDGRDAVPPAPTPGAPLPLAVTASFDRPLVVGPGLAVVRGRVTGADVAGRTVEVRLRHAFGGGTAAWRGIVGPRGAFAIAVRPRVASVAAVTVLGPDGTALARTTTSTIRVRPVLRASVTRRGGVLRLAGTLAPGGGPSVRLVWQARTSPGAAWQAFCAARLVVDRPGAFAARCGSAPAHAGTQYRVAFVAQPGGPYLAATSAAGPRVGW